MEKTLKTQMKEPNLESRQKNLEQYLKQEAHISWQDRLKNVSYNVKNNAGKLLPFGIIALGATGLAASDFITLANHNQLLSNYTEAQNIVTSLHETLEVVVNSGLEVQVSPEMIELPKTLIEQGIQQSYAEEGRAISNNLNQNMGLFSPGSATKPLAQYLGTLKDNLDSIGYSKQSMLGIRSMCALGISALAFVYAYAFSTKSALGYQLEGKKRLKKQLNQSLPKLRGKFANNPNAEQVYDYFDAVIESGIRGSDLLENANVISGYSDEKYSSVFETINSHPEKYQDKRDLQTAFQKYA